MNGEKIKVWSTYVLMFFALWALNLVVSLAPKVPAQELKTLALRDMFRAAVVAVPLLLIHLSIRKKG